MSASINGEVIESIGCYFTNVEAMGSDVIGELTVEIPPSYIMDSGPGQVTIEVKAVSTTKWDASETVIGQFRVTTQEDDVTFITAKDTVIVANPGFEFYGLGEAQIRVNGGDMMDWEGESIVETLRDQYNLHVEQIETQSDPYDPYSIVRAIMFKHLGTGSIHVEVLLQNTPTVTPTPDNDGVNFDYEDAVFSMDLGEYVPMYTGKALLHPDVRLWNDGTTVAANDPNLKLKYVIEDMYLGTLLPEGTLFTNSNGDVIPYASEEYVPVVTNMGKGEYGFISASVYVGDDYINTTIYSHDESICPSRIVSSAVFGDTTSFTLNGQAYTLEQNENHGVALDKTDVVIQAGDFTVDLQLPLELVGYKLQGPWPFAHEQTATVDESGHVSLTVTSGGMYGTREPFVFYVKLFNEFGAGDFVAMSISYGNPNTGD